MRTWMTLIPAVFLVVPVAGSSLRADAETNDKKIEQLQKDVKDLRKDLNDLKDKVNDNSVRGAQVATDLQDIKKMLRDMANRDAVSTREAGYDPRSLQPGASPGAPMPTTATIALHNEYSAPATVRINGQSYTVAPYQTRLVRGVPVGPFQYSVDVEGFGMPEPPRNDTLRPTGYRISIFPRMPY